MGRCDDLSIRNLDWYRLGFCMFVRAWCCLRDVVSCGAGIRYCLYGGIITHGIKMDLFIFVFNQIDVLLIHVV